MGRTSSSLLLLGLALSGVQCRTPENGSKSKFDWDTDLSPLPQDTSPTPASKEAAAPLEKSFCKGEDPGRCLTLIVRIPTSDLVADMGLSALALASQSRTMSIRLNEACQSAWVDYQERFKNAPLNPVRQAFVNKVRKARCFFMPMSQEYILETTPLASNEIGISVRLTKFEIFGKNDTATLGFLKLARDQTTVDTQFRSVAVFAGKDVKGQNSPWQALPAFRVAPTLSRQPLGREISWQIDTAQALSSLSQIDTSKIKDQTDQAVRSFVEKAKSTLAASTAGGASLGSSMVLVGMGYQAYKSLCGEDQRRCTLTSSTSSKMGDMSQSLQDIVPSSESNEVLRTALIKSIQGVFDKVFESSDSKQIAQEFKLN